MPMIKIYPNNRVIEIFVSDPTAIVPLEALGWRIKPIDLLRRQL